MASFAALYSADFYDELLREVPASAEAIVPVVVNELHPRSIVDFGCGNGAWLSAFARAGVEDYIGIDGYTPPEQLFISPDRFRTADLTRPIDLGRRFDLAISLEVAEHLPEAFGDTFVASLVHAAPVVLFSAAIPHQGGTGHINEQWPEYWRAKFAKHRYNAADLIRPLIWGRETIASYYQQNIIIYADTDRVGSLADRVVPPDRSLDLVHPRFFVRAATAEPTLGQLLGWLPRVTARSLVFHARRLVRSGNQNP